LSASVARKPTCVERVGHALRALAPRQRRQRLGNDLADALARIERSVRILEHHLEVAARAAQRRRRQRVQVAAEQDDASRRGRLEGHHQARERRLARARLAHDAEAAARLEREADALQRVHHRGPAPAGSRAAAGSA
jgi:hypothetical protein